MHKKQKKTLEQEINEFLNVFGKNDLSNLLTDILPLLELYNVTEDKDWVRDAVGDEDCKNVRLIRTVYLMSWFCERHTSKMVSIKTKFKDLWRRLEKEGATGG